MALKLVLAPARPLVVVAPFAALFRLIVQTDGLRRIRSGRRDEADLTGDRDSGSAGRPAEVEPQPAPSLGRKARATDFSLYGARCGRS